MVRLRYELFVLSAPDQETLDARAASFRRLAEARPDRPLRDLARNTATLQTHGPFRLAAIAADTADLAVRLAEGGASRRVLSSRDAAVGSPRTLFVFSGHGGLDFEAARILHQDEIVFRQAVDAAIEAMTEVYPLPGVVEALANGGSGALSLAVAHRLLFATQVGLVRLLLSWGVRADGVIGHSVGEIAAAFAAGALSLNDAARIVAMRTMLSQEAEGNGAMVSLPLAEEAVRGRLIDGVSIAALNSPSSTVVSGDAEAVETFVAALTAEDVSVRRLADTAGHSPLMSPFADRLRESLPGLAAAQPEILFYSSVEGGRLTRRLDRDYWAANLVEPVRFAPALVAAAGDGFGHCLEIGPDPVLSPLVEEASGVFDTPPVLLPLLRRRRAPSLTTAQALARLHVDGAQLDWSGVYPSAAEPPWDGGRRLAETG
jgi:malonyl CoA-acyl carrier protein transacylase